MAFYGKCFRIHTNQSSESKVNRAWATVAEGLCLLTAVTFHKIYSFPITPISVPQDLLLNERQQVFIAIHKNLQTVHHSSWYKTLDLFLFCLSHLGCFRRAWVQAGVCFMCLIDTWARALTQMLHSLCTGTNKTRRRSLSVFVTEKQTGEVDGAAGEHWPLHANFFWQEATV